MRNHEKSLEDQCNRLAMEIEAQLGPKSHTSATERIEGLKKIFWDFLLFKQRLESQDHSYYLELYNPGTPSDKESMSTLSGLADSNSVVEYTIFPAVHGVVRSEVRVIAKARVELISPGEEPTTERLFVLPKKPLEQPWGEADEGHTKGLLETILSVIPKGTIKWPIEKSTQSHTEHQPCEEPPSQEPNVEEL